MAIKNFLYIYTLINTLFTLTCVLYNHRILRNFVYKANNRIGGFEESVLAQFFQVRLRLSLACFHLFLFVYKHDYIADWDSYSKYLSDKKIFTCKCYLQVSLQCFHWTQSIESPHEPTPSCAFDLKYFIKDLNIKQLNTWKVGDENTYKMVYLCNGI